MHATFCLLLWFYANVLEHIEDSIHDTIFMGNLDNAKSYKLLNWTPAQVLMDPLYSSNST